MLVDYGFAQQSRDQDNNPMTIKNCFGSQPYIAPEVYSPNIDGYISFEPEKADVYSLGVLLNVLFNFKYPFRFDGGNNY